MKKITIWFIIVFCFQILNAGTFTQTYNFEMPQFISNDGYTELIYQNCRNFGEEGYPALPHMAANILLQQSQEIEEIKILSTIYYPTQDDIVIKPAERQFPLSSDKHATYKVIPNEKIYSSTRSLPEESIDNISTHFLSGHSIASFTICPVIYQPSEKRVKFIKEITVEVLTSTTNRALNAEKFLQDSQIIRKRIGNIIENPEILSQYNYQNLRDMPIPCC